MKTIQRLTASYIVLIVVGIFLVLAMACSQNQSSQDASSTDTGAILFSLVWDDPSSSQKPATASARYTSSNVCVDFKINQIKATVLSSSDAVIKEGTPWNCEAHQGTIMGLSPQADYRVLVQGTRDGLVVWEGQRDNITVVNGEITMIENPIVMSYIGDETDPPEIVSTSPETLAVSAPVGTVITVTFDTDLAPNSINSNTFTLSTGGNPVSGQASYDDASKTATFTPDNPLDVMTEYTASISMEAASINNISLASNYEWSFTTAKILWLSKDGALVKFSTDQSELTTIDDVNCQSLSAYTQFAIDPNDNSLWLSDTNNDRVIKVDETGKLITIIDQWSAEGTVVDPRDGSVWSSKLYQNPDYNRTFVNYSPLGFQIRETAGGLDTSLMDNAMGWDSSDNSIWFANYNTDVVKLMNTNSLGGYNASGPSGASHLRISGFDGQPFEVSVFSGSSSSTNTPCVWVADRGGNLVKLSTGGSELLRIDPAGIGEVRYLSADPTDGSVWITGTGTPWRVAKYAYDGSLLVSPVAIVEGPNTVEADPLDGGVYIGTNSELIRLDAEGVELWRYAGDVQSIAIPIYQNDSKRINVASDGDDIDGDGSQANPYASIGKAIQEANDGDSIQVGSGTYNENLVLKSGVKMIGMGADVTTIQGLGTSHVVDGIAVSSVILDGFTITGSSDTSSGIHCDQCTNLVIRDNIIRDNGDSTTSNGITLQGASEALVEHNTITGNSEGGMFISGDGRVIVRNNIIANNGDTGIYRGYGSNVSLIVNNTIDGNGTESGGRSGIMVFSNDIIMNNIISNNGSDNPNPGLAVGIYIGGMGSPVLSYNNVWNNFQGPYTGISAGTGDINLDPQFTDRLSGDFSLLATSPSINTGNPNLYDLDCSRSDMGADGGPY